ncbi:DUF3718 domain-containing protein [Pseudocolwellia agarivorans]|uniref:DUF3718 domain-containing protein n=1 Tax=Pseudocolwellia agarivorans TaxID=1911682 RepID=UPI0015890F2A|nr:DUF3718 domain-containing protein [Pseudocolwellia agarivorans]
MKTLTKKLTVSILFLFTTTSIFAASFEAANNSSTTQICIAAVKGSKAQLHVKIKESGLSKVFVANNVKCNNQDIISFVAQNGKAPKVINKVLSRYQKNNNHPQTSLAKL